MWRQRQRLERCVSKPRNTREGSDTKSLEKGREEILPRTCRKSTALWMSWFWTSSLQDCKTINLCCFKPSSPVCSTLLVHPLETNTPSQSPGSAYWACEYISSPPHPTPVYHHEEKERKQAQPSYGKDSGQEYRWSSSPSFAISTRPILFCIVRDPYAHMRTPQGKRPCSIHTPPTHILATLQGQLSLWRTDQGRGLGSL